MFVLVLLFCTKFYGNQSSSCLYISFKTKSQGKVSKPTLPSLEPYSLLTCLKTYVKVICYIAFKQNLVNYLYKSTKCKCFILLTNEYLV